MDCNDTIKLVKYMKIYIIGRNMRINNLDIKGIGGIKQLKLNFCNGFNVICGANGIGKTTILNIIADAFANGETKLRRNAECDEGQYTIQYSDGKKDDEIIVSGSSHGGNGSVGLSSHSRKRYYQRERPGGAAGTAGHEGFPDFAL